MSCLRQSIEGTWLGVGEFESHAKPRVRLVRKVFAYFRGIADQADCIEREGLIQ